MNGYEKKDNKQEFGENLKYKIEEKNIKAIKDEKIDVFLLEIKKNSKILDNLDSERLHILRDYLKKDISDKEQILKNLMANN